MKRTALRIVLILLGITGALYSPGFCATAQAQSCSSLDQKCTTVLTTLTKANQQENSPDIYSAAGAWEITITVTGRVSSFGFNIKNNPGAGDICFHWGQRNPATGTSTISTSPYVVPAATTGACGNQFKDTNGDPLTLFVNIQTGDSKAAVDVKVTYFNPNYVPTTSRLLVPGRREDAAKSLADLWFATESEWAIVREESDALRIPF